MATADANTHTPEVHPADRQADFVQSMARGIEVLKAFSSQADGLTIADVARRTGLSRAVARRFLLTFIELGYVTVDQGEFRLTPRVLELGYTFLSTMRLPEVAQPVMEDLVDRLHESCSVSVLDGDDIVYIVRVPAKRIMSVSLTVGSRLPAYPTSMGRVLLAELPAGALAEYLSRAPLHRITERTVTDPAVLRRILEQVRQRGWASVDQEVEVGVRSVAAPLRDHSGSVVAAMNVSAHVSRVSIKHLREHHLPALLDAAREISRRLGARL